jgi:hypothetical protein
MSYVVRSDITYGTGERSLTYWTGGSVWAYHPHTYSAVQFDEFEGLRDE